MKMLARTKTLLTAMAFAGLAGAAQADALRIAPTTVGTGPGSSYSHLVSLPEYRGVATQWTVNNQTTGDRFLAYCMEISQTLQQGAEHEYVRSEYTASADIAELYDRFYADATAGNKEMAITFQLALWMLLDQVAEDHPDNQAKPYVTAADALIDVVRSSDTGYDAGQYQYYRWTNDSQQDILQVLANRPNEVPEPHTHALLLGSLGLLAAMRSKARRREAKA